ncbi:MAG: hemolysin family protein [Defluviitaleaceae bacterium]|nr:hemolysin family protein [Defluviitaleaceae bacterium]
MGEDPLIRHIFLQLSLILINSVFSCAEIAVISFNPNRLEKLSAAGDKRASRLLSLTKQPAKFLATIQVGTVISGIFAGAVAAENFSERLIKLFVAAGFNESQSLKTASVAVIITVIAYFTIVFGELIPKRLAMQNAEKMSLAISGLVVFIARIFAPVVWILTASTNGFLKLFRIDPHTAEEKNTEEEILLMAEAGSETGTIDEAEKELIQNVFELDNTQAVEVMTHRTEIVVLKRDESDCEWERVINESRHSHYPICGEDRDDIVGVLLSKEYLRLKDRSRENVIERAVVPAQFVPESVSTDVLLRNMKKNRNHFAVVLDEYGGLSGIVTMTDLLEQLVGDLEDDHGLPPDKPDIEVISANTAADGTDAMLEKNKTIWRISGTASLSDVARELDAELPTDEYDTFAGFVLGLLGTIPHDGETPELNEFGLSIKIAEIKDHRLEYATVQKT